MSITIAVYAQGEMGAGVARRLTDNGARVITVLDGRSEASRARAEEARMEPVSWSDIASADMFLSITPPGIARELAEKTIDLWTKAARAPVFVDCNAVSPETAREIGALFEARKFPFVDAGIIGSAPKPGGPSPRIYACGEPAQEFEKLKDYGLDIVALPGAIGTASAVKMSYAGITKGITAIFSIMALAAERNGAADALKKEFLSSQPELANWAARQVPRMLPKAYRWGDEMREIGQFHQEDIGTALYDAIARFYDSVAEEEAGAKRQTAPLRTFFG